MNTIYNFLQTTDLVSLYGFLGTVGVSLFGVVLHFVLYPVSDFILRSLHLSDNQ